MNEWSLSPLLHRFFTDRLRGQLGVSPHTVASYRDTFRILLQYATKRRHRQPSELAVDELDASFLADFLDHLERERGNSVRTRNARLAALHGFFKFVALNEPALALHCQRVLAIPPKRHHRTQVEFLTQEETAALTAAPPTDRWIGRRDRTLLLLAAQTGLRNSELTSLRRQDVELGTGAHVRCVGKGRKARCTPLHEDVVRALKQWLSEQDEHPTAPLFPSSRGGVLSADALQRLVARHVKSAARRCPTLATKSVTPHTLRHGAAMDLLRRGVPPTVIALWLGHESPETTQIYVHADMGIKERALAHATSKGRRPPRYRPPDRLLAFLEGL
jgi:site-specific recombinase XerD